MSTPQLSARLRGGGCGVLVGALAVAAHGIGGGGVPRSAEISLLLLVSLAAGAFARGGPSRTGHAAPQSRSGTGTPAVRAALALLGGQWAGHFALSATLDHHGDLLHLPSTPMIAAHLVAAFVCAALILTAERLYLVASSTLRAVLGTPASPVGPRTTRWLATVAAPRGARPRSARCPRAPPLFV
ncbi:hypothetical protein ACFXK0_03935 [Nocardia sp. NPDC059177]|uniref:hypothetical protein n=1 Tax=Nocardia sp. NPDC059177 TaxID=3346759 RepID=UPI0036D0A041